MARVCTICARPDAGTINALLAEGRSARSVAAEYGLSEDATQRHAARHLAARRKLSDEATVSRPRPVAQLVDDPLDELVDALRTQALAGNPAIVHQYRLALAAQAEARHAIPQRRDLAAEPEWLALRDRLLVALAPFPEARLAVVVAIGGTS